MSVLSLEEDVTVCGLVDVESMRLSGMRLRTAFAQTLRKNLNLEEVNGCWESYTAILRKKAIALRNTKQAGWAMSSLLQAMNEAAAQNMSFSSKVSSLIWTSSDTTEKGYDQASGERWLDHLEARGKSPLAFSRANCELLAQDLLRTLGDRDTVCLKVLPTSQSCSAHREACFLRPTTCPQTRCGLPLSVGRLAAHEGRCHYKEVVCPAGCDVPLVRMDLANHPTTCPMRPVDCPYHILGCKAVMPYKMLEDHLNHPRIHLDLLLDRIGSQCERLDTVDQRLAALQKQKEDIVEETLARTKTIKAMRNAMKDTRKDIASANKTLRGGVASIQRNVKQEAQKEVGHQ